MSWGRAQQENTGRENLGNTREASSEAPPNLSFQWSKDLALSDKRGQCSSRSQDSKPAGKVQRSVVKPYQSTVRESLVCRAHDEQQRNGLVLKSNVCARAWNPHPMI